MNEAKQVLENIDTLDAKKILSRDFDSFDTDRVIQSVEKVKIQPDNTISDANGATYSFRSFISDGTYLRPESARIRVQLTIFDNALAVVAGFGLVTESGTLVE